VVTLQDAKEGARALTEALSPAAVVVFGSVAGCGKGNDLDILVVTESENSHQKVALSLRGFYSRSAVGYLVASREEITRSFRRGSPFLTLVQKEGKVLYMKDSIRQWVELAAEDLRQARYLLQGGFCRRLVSLLDAHGLAVERSDEDVDLMDSIFRGPYPAEEGLLPLGSPTREDASRAVFCAEALCEQTGLPFDGGPSR